MKKELEKKLKNVNKCIILKEDVKKLALNDHLIYYSIFTNKDSKNLKAISDKLLDNSNNTISILISKSERKVTSVIGVSRNFPQKLDAVELIRFITPILGGKGGGGKKELAQGGGIEPNKSEEAINKTIDYIKSKI